MQTTWDTTRSIRTALTPSDVVPNATSAINEHMEPLQVMGQGLESRLWSLANRLIATLGAESNPSLTQNLLEDLAKKVLDNKDSITGAMMQLLTSDIQAHLTADTGIRKLAYSIANRMASLADDLVVANSHPDPTPQLTQEFLHHHGCSSWEQQDEKIRHLENDAYVGQFITRNPQAQPSTGRPPQPPTGTVFDANLIQLEQKESATFNNTWGSDLSSLVATRSLCNEPSLEPFDGRGKRTSSEFLRDFRWRYGQLPENVQRAFLSSSLIGNAKDVFNSLEPRIQEGPFDGLLTALQQALAQTTHTSFKTLTAHLRLCTRQTSQPLTLYLTELELTAQRLYVPRDTKDKEFVEVTKANVLMENVHEKDLARDLLEVLNTTASSDSDTTSWS
ncbi:hypothetical protein AAVH_27667 [Aphelenchoides avenae]|nr:hypothetical protein AAVH_27667 [Aphelenchus avenae]